MANESLEQLPIDFLPNHYREEFAQRKSHIWRIVWASAAGVVMLIAAVVQWNIARKLEAVIEEISPMHDAAHERTVYLTSLKKELSTSISQAELITYLSHPWPKTQVLAAVLEPLPTSIKLGDLTITRADHEHGTVLPSQAARQGDAAGKDSDKAKKEKPDPSIEDLKAMRAECDASTQTVLLAGETSSISDLHQYLSDVGRSPLVSKAELRSVENSSRTGESTTFRARILIRPGYGQPEGPTEVLAPAPAQIENTNSGEAGQPPVAVDVAPAASDSSPDDLPVAPPDQHNSQSAAAPVRPAAPPHRAAQTGALPSSA